jgi:hypothetical protein
VAGAQGPYELDAAGRFELEEGGVIPNLQLAYATYGTLNEAKDNAILIPTWYSGTNQTWEQVYIGPGRALDPERYVSINKTEFWRGIEIEGLEWHTFQEFQANFLVPIFGAMDPNALLAMAWK